MNTSRPPSVSPTALSRASTTQRGVAVIAALLIVALASLAVTGVLWRQQVLARSVENQIALAQSRWLARAAVDWARAILRDDALKTSIDHQREFWAVPIGETRISDAEGVQGNEAWLSGGVADEQGKFNLLNLATNGYVDNDSVASFRRLLSAVDLPETLADRVADAIRLTQAQRDADGKVEPAKALPWLDVQDLAQVEGVDADTIERLKPHVAVLPRIDEQPTPININTASAEVLYATIPTLSRAQSLELAASRDKIYFNNTGDLQTRLTSVGATVPQTDLSGVVDVSTRYFRVQGRIRYERALMHVESLVWRDSGGATRVLWMREG
ncbi:MAG TPA: type II secretion system minor pseudopilin GspK [Burkholderiaceae bacterium]|nr:type II secretion system minor pseudopilin GspK [Burkholderiaceae bacterium]